MAEISRRALLGAGAGTAGLLALGIAEAPADAAASRDAAPALRRSQFTGSVGKVFQAERHGHTFRMRLDRIADTTQHSAKQRPHCFVLVFTPLHGAARPDGIYTVRRSGVPTHRLFLSGLGSEATLQAVVNRPV